MNWDTKRQLVYALAGIVLVSAIGVFLMRNILFPIPTCFDHAKNGYEIGIDCGGTCALRCQEEVNPLTVVWAKAIKTGKTAYDLVAFVTNTNIDNASKELGYTFTLYNSQGVATETFLGSTTAPLDGKFPLIIQNLSLIEVPSHVVVTLSDGPHYTVTEKPTSPTVRVLDRKYEGGQTPRVYATVMNTKQKEINNLPVRVLLFDDKDNVYGDGQTIIKNLPKEGVKEIVITWSEPLAFPPTRIGIYPIFNPFEASGY